MHLFAVERFQSSNDGNLKIRTLVTKRLISSFAHF